ncbi:MAG: hypothetical protein U5J63_13215 [Fodinibius sp.]|nr:hypothetical protein [Fodinibius sp.]
MHIQHYLTSGEAVDYLQERINQQVEYYDLDNLIRANAIEPPQKIGGRRMWSPEDLKAAAKALRIRRLKRPSILAKKSLSNQSQEENSHG